MTHTLRPVSLRCEYRKNPAGIDALAPRLFWKIDAQGRHAVKQSAYQIIVGNGDKWDTGKVISSQTAHISYEGTPLSSRERVEWKVRIWDEQDRGSEWSETAFWQMGLLAAEDWKGRWISLDPLRPHAKLQPPSYLRRNFTIGSSVVRATLTATARGVYLPYLNGKKVGDAYLAPGWTDYHKRIAYQSYNVTSLLNGGDNVIGALLGDGWYAGYVGWESKHDLYGSRPQLLAQLDIELSDGTTQTVTTDDHWIGSAGPIQYSDLQAGELYDSRLANKGWSTLDYDTAGWRTVKIEQEHEATIALVSQIDPPVRITQELPAKAISQPTPGSYVFDLGQNMVGWSRLKTSGPAGTIVRLRFGEMLNTDGTLYVANLRGAGAVDMYILNGNGVELFEPSFTFHGFRYVEATGLSSAPDLETITGIVVHSDTPKTGSFDTENSLVNQLVSNIDWGQRGNFISIPTDCPQRDERLGWMGDAQIFVRTAASNRDVAPFFEKFMCDVVDAQSPAGAFKDISPVIPGLGDAAAAWGDAGIIIPWTIYQMYGDKHILSAHYEAMAKWVTWLSENNSNNLWLNARNNDYGDWLSIDADTNKDVLATAYFAYDAALMSKIAAVLGKSQDTIYYQTLFNKIKVAFNEAYVAPDGTVMGDTQTAYVLALHFDLLPGHLRATAAEKLVANIASKDGHLSTGFVGVGYLCPVLSNAGYDKIAYDLLLNKTFPSWGYSIEHGATTIWERWDGWTADKGFQDVGMNSFNHYSLGSVGEWLQRYSAGIDTDPDRPGFEHILLTPRPDRRLGSVHASLDSIHGKIVSQWRYIGGKINVHVTIPANTTATLTLPDENKTVLNLGSGSYEYSI
jgi:alpha-L-rhamnosidase